MIRSNFTANRTESHPFSRLVLPWPSLAVDGAVTFAVSNGVVEGSVPEEGAAPEEGKIRV